ncbi:MAG: 2Fe-2S iron-sulfur cluster-binding protein [Pseudomonadota bacterium]|nr:2Fe-2S iron-sulfur cluster-binding protein [Pseudomonadota bacterium]
MSGKNPYIKPPKTTLPTQSYRIFLEGLDAPIVVEPSELPYNQPGLPGSLLSTLLAKGIEIDHACGGVCACSTCHIVVKKGLDSTNEANDDEEDMLDEAPALTSQSRLACQCVPDGTADLHLKIPEWNRNMVKEGH